MLDSRYAAPNRKSPDEPAEQERPANRREAGYASQNQEVYYPTLFEDTEQLRIYNQQCDFPGGLVSVDLLGGKPAAFDFLRHLRLARNAVSLGGVETLACHPRSTTHSAWSAHDLDEAGIGDGLVRVSLGIENWRDLLADFEAALDQV